MKRLYLTVFIISLILPAVSCHRSPSEFRIYGTVINPEGKDLEGRYIFLVPLPVVEENIDSVRIRNHRFEFRGDSAYMAELRIEMKHRIGTENLLVVTEPGDIRVTIGPDSSGGGTPQNDSLQVWKNITQAHYAEISGIHNKKVVREKNEEYRTRTIQLAGNVGEDTPLGKFLMSMYGRK